MADKYDVIVVGGGNGGLTAAATAAKNGLKTLLIEKHNLPGGCATSFRRGRFEFEASLHELCLFGPKEQPGPVRKMFDELKVDCGWVMIPDAFRSINTSPDGFDVVMPTGVKQYIDAMEKAVPGSRESLTKVFECSERMNRVSDHMYDIGWESHAMDMMCNYREFLKLSVHSVNDVLRRFKVPEKAMQIFDTYWDYIGADSETMSFPVYAIMYYSYLTMGAWMPKMRSHEISVALDKSIRDFGGETWYNTEVTRILAKNGRVYGVETPEGPVFADHVICNIMPHVVYGRMMDKNEVPARALRMENARTIGMRGYCVFLGLDKSREELGIKDYTVFIRNSGDTVKQNAAAGSIATHNTGVYNCTNVVLPDASPEGTCMFIITKLYSADTWKDVAETDYVNTKEKVAKDAVALYEKTTGIKISDCVEECEIATPVTYARYLGTPQGTIYGYKPVKWDGMLNRILDEQHKDYMVKGLRFCGGHAALLDGYSQAYMSGHAIAKFTLKDIKEGV